MSGSGEGRKRGLAQESDERGGGGGGGGGGQREGLRKGWLCDDVTQHYCQHRHMQTDGIRVRLRRVMLPTVQLRYSEDET